MDYFLLLAAERRVLVIRFKYDFSMSWTSDVQYTSEFYEDILLQQKEWIAETQDEYKSVMNIDTGDVANAAYLSWEYNWKTVDRAYQVLEEAKVPYTIAWGNHDYKYVDKYNLIPNSDRLYRQYFPLSRSWTLGLNMQIGYGDTYGDEIYPFFKNFYAGGIGSVRGFESSSLGPRDVNGDNLGGDREFVFSAELLTPLPGADRTLRGLLFFDAGNVWGYRGRRVSPQEVVYEHEDLDFGNLRYSVGFGIAWISPLGPLKFSLAFPLNEKEGDDTQRFQFQIGTGF